MAMRTEQLRLVVSAEDAHRSRALSRRNELPARRFREQGSFSPDGDPAANQRQPSACLRVGSAQAGARNEGLAWRNACIVTTSRNTDASILLVRTQKRSRQEREG